MHIVKFSESDTVLYMQGLAVAEIGVGGNPEMPMISTPELRADLGNSEREVVNSVFRQWEDQLLASPFAMIKYANGEEFPKARDIRV